MPTRLRELASVIRSKNAGPFEVSIDLMFDDDAAFESALAAAALTPAAIARRCGLDEADVLDVIAYAPARAIKIDLRRRISSGAVGDRDVYGAQQYAPLLDVEIP